MIMSENTMLADSSKKPSRVLFIIVGIGAVGLLLFFVVHSIQKRRSVAEAARLASAPHTLEVRVVAPSLAPDTAIILLPGTVQGHRETSLYARVNGYIRNWYVDIGDPVKEGQLLAELETPELDQQLAQARANLELAKSSLERENSVTLEGADSTQQKADRDGAYSAALALANQHEAQKSYKRLGAPFSHIINYRNI